MTLDHLCICSDTIGQGNPELGALLMKNYLYTLARAEHKPAHISLMNAGVKLACQGSESVEDLKLLVEAGVDLKACGTCLGFFELKESLVVGEIGTMPLIVEKSMTLPTVTLS